MALVRRREVEVLTLNLPRGAVLVKTTLGKLAFTRLNSAGGVLVPALTTYNPVRPYCRNPDFVSEFHFRVGALSVFQVRVGA